MPITGHTRVFGILAHPVRHVRTPQALNALFSARDYDGVLVPVDVEGDAGLDNALAALRAFRNWGGAIVTVPHKTAAMALCDRISERAAIAGAVNVIRREADGSLSGELLDGVGFVRGLRESGHQLAGKRAFLAGAGGAASAIAFALAEAGIAHLTVVNRTRDKSAALASRLHERFPALGLAVEGTPAGHDLVVNGTSLGLRESDALPVDPAFLCAPMLVAEVVMMPEHTALLQAARSRGCAIQPGKAMLDGQLIELFDFLTAPDPSLKII